jgi:co-chaperonin GroES (HSP10)
MQVIGDKVLIELYTDEKLGTNGLILPENLTKSKNRGKVIAKGNGPVVDQILIGELVIFTEYHAIETPYGHIVRGFDIIATIA